MVSGCNRTQALPLYYQQGNDMSRYVVLPWGVIVAIVCIALVLAFLSWLGWDRWTDLREVT